MKSLMRNSVYQAKILFRDFGFTFWTLAFPLILISFLYIAFSGISNQEEGRVNIGLEKDNSLLPVLEEIDMVNIKLTSRDGLDSSLEKEEIDGFIDKDLKIVVKDMGLKQTIIREIVSQVKQINALEKPLENFDFSRNYIEEEEHSANGIFVIFYSLIAMLSSYSLFAGIELVSIIQGNLSSLGARLTTSALRKGEFLLGGIMVALILNILSNTILIGFISLVLKMDLFTELKYSMVLLILGNLFGVALGIFIGLSNKRSSGSKTMIGIASTLVLSFLSGLMSVDIKILIDRKFPLLGKINPINIISTNLFRVNLLDSNKGLASGFSILIAYIVILVLASYMFLRRRDYDSV